jgi:DNA-binding CsgD family transcriptional regulator
LSRFKGEAYESGLREFLKDKYRDKPIGVIVAVGGAALERVLKWRTELWPDVPVVFAMVEKSDFDRRKPPPDVTGSIVRLRLADAIKTAHAVVPHLKSVVLVVVDRPRAQLAARRDPDQSCPSSVRPCRSSSSPAMEMSRTQCGPSRRGCGQMYQSCSLWWRNRTSIGWRNRTSIEDFLTKPVSSEQLLLAIEKAMAHHQASRGQRQKLDALRELLGTLTPRERQVFERVVHGKINKQIARELGATERTIKAHRQRVMEKMKVQSLAELVSLAERLGILAAGPAGKGSVSCPHCGHSSGQLECAGRRPRHRGVSPPEGGRCLASGYLYDRKGQSCDAHGRNGIRVYRLPDEALYGPIADGADRAGVRQSCVAPLNLIHQYPAEKFAPERPCGPKRIDRAAARC